MSWSDPCGVCGRHRADCECDTYDDVDGKYSKKVYPRRLTQKEKEKICEEKGHQWAAVITVYCSRCGYDEGY